MLSRALMQASMSIAISGVNALKLSKSSSLRGLAPKRRMDIDGPSRASGGMMALTREPSGRRASTMGEVSSTRRPTLDTMRSMICIRWSLSRNLTSVFSSLPRRSTINLVRAVDQDIADGRVLEQHFERAEAEGLVEHLVDEAFAFHAVEQRIFGIAQAFDHQANFAAQRVAGQVADARQVELVDQLAVNEPLEIFEAFRRHRGTGRFGKCCPPG